MKSNRKTIILLVLFFGLLLVMWGLDRSGRRTQWDVERRADRVLPDLIDTPEQDIRRVAIDRGSDHLVFERKDEGLGRWQIVEPMDVAAEPTRLDILVRNLKDLRRSPEAGTLTGPPDSFGLAPPAAVVRLYAGAKGSRGPEEPIATLEVGKVVRSQRYVHPVGGPGIEVVDARILRGLDLPVADWRQPVLMGAPSFEVVAVKITRPGVSGTEPKVIRAERDRDGRWKLKEPLEVLANGPKIESLLAALASLRVVDIPKGYVADDVKDFAPFGLATPEVTVEVTTQNRAGVAHLVLNVGKSVPDEPERVFVRQGDQDDVVKVDARPLTEIPESPTVLRSQQVADIVPAAVRSIEIQTRRDVFKLSKDSTGWELTSPRHEKADLQTVQKFLTHIENLQTSEFLDPEKVTDPKLDPPIMSIRIDQAAPRPPVTGRAAQSDAKTRPTLELDLGAQDVLKKSIYARLKGDRMILALPDVLLDVLPKNPYSFSDRTMISFDPTTIRKLTIRRGGRTDEFEPDPSAEPNAWRMLAPVQARADTASIVQMLTALSHIRAEDFLSVPSHEWNHLGLDRPAIEVAWESDGAHRLKIGNAVPRSLNYYASLDGQPLAFVLAGTTVRLFDAEFHDHRVLTFPTARAQRVLLRWPNRTVSLRRRLPKEMKRGLVEWVPEPGTEADGIDLSRISDLVRMMSQLRTTRFLQYDGDLPIAAGLTHPRFRVEIALGSQEPHQVLRIGVPTDDGNVCATVAAGDSGPTFLLHAPPWNELIRSGERYDPIPDNPFAPAP
jgi:Domain of unknown function (DUF4340)